MVGRYKQRKKSYIGGKDSAECLGYKNTRDAIIKHVFADDKVVGQVDTPGGKQNMILINESGLYSLG